MHPVDPRTVADHPPVPVDPGLPHAVGDGALLEVPDGGRKPIRSDAP